MQIVRPYTMVVNLAGALQSTKSSRGRFFVRMQCQALGRNRMRATRAFDGCSAPELLLNLNGSAPPKLAFDPSA